jgi:mannose-6-phosphate isomerase-like protein (cupin superfamily)
VKIRVREQARWQTERLAKVALAATSRVQLDLYCVGPGQAQAPHAHGDQDKIYLVLEGQGRFTVGGRDETLGAGEAIVAPAGQEHGLVNDGTGPLLVVVVMSPPPAH